MGDMNGFPSVGTPVLRRPSGDVYLNKFRMFRSAGQIDNDAGIERTLHETVFTGMAISTFTNGQVVTLSDGLTYGAGVPTGGGVEITGTGLKHTHPTVSSETSFTLTAANNGGRSVLHKVLGQGRLRRGRWGIWVRASAYDLATTAWHYAVTWGLAYPNNYAGVRRARNQSGAANNATGAYLGWIANGGADGVGVFSAGSENTTSSNTSHNGAEDCICVYFHSSGLWDIYYGTWDNGWPDFDDMEFGFRGNLLPGRNDIDDALYMRDPMFWNLGIGGGGYSSSASNTFTIDRWRITTWE